MIGNVRFGTDGWRAMIARSFTFRNVQIFAQSVADYIVSDHGKNSNMVIGYDTRFLADRFAREIAAIFNKNGILVYFTQRDVPVPVVALSVLEKKAAGALMVTASSLSHEYCGIKFIPAYAGPADEEITDQIECRLRVYENEFSYDNEAEIIDDLFVEFDPMEDYIDYVKGFIDLDRIQEAQLNLIINPIFGTGRGYLESILEDICTQIIVINDHIDCLFGGHVPDTEEENLFEDKRLVLENGFDLAISLDGDADRFGVIDKDGTFITPNQMLVLLLYHLVCNRGYSGKVVKSVSTTRMLDRLCTALGLKMETTPVGFNFIGKKMRMADVIIGGEESGGLSIKGYLPEKDGILAALLAVELIAYEEKSLSDILIDIEQKTGKFYSRRIDVTLSGNDVFTGFNAGGEITVMSRTASGKEMFDGIMYDFDDGSWIYVRPSGTRNVLRIYLECVETNRLDCMENEIKNIVVKIIKSEVYL